MKSLRIILCATVLTLTFAFWCKAAEGLSADEWLDKGVASEEAGDYHSAIKAYGKAIELNPKHALAYGYRGNAYSGLGEKKTRSGTTTRRSS